MSNKIFNKVALSKPATSTFDLTHDVKMSGKMGALLPCMAIDCLPGDKIQIGADALIRMAPMLAPLMHRIDFTVHYWFVPNRLLWSNFDKFISGTTDGGGENYIPPYVNYDNTIGASAQALGDYLGIPPPSSSQSENVSALPFAAYNLIYNEYYRDQNLIQPLGFTELADGDNTGAFNSSVQIRYRAWEHDYFTSALPFAQKGQAVDLPLGNVTLEDDWNSVIGATPRFLFDNGTTGTGDITATPAQTEIIGYGLPVAYDPDGSLVVNPTTINDLRRAFALQAWLERNARGGTRYTEFIQAHWDVKNPDARLQRPEYVTGIKGPVVISEVLNTTGPTDFYNGSGQVVQTGSPQGDMAGHGVGVHMGKIGRYYVTEYGWMIGIINIQPKTAYMQGIPKMFTRYDAFDYAVPSFANLGEQEILLREVYAYTTDSNEVFGYIPRYAEYKFMNSRVAGDFRTTLDFWHLARVFGSPPALNQDFIECKPNDLKRIFAVQDETDNIWMHILHKIRATRKLPFFGTPTI